MKSINYDKAVKYFETLLDTGEEWPEAQYHVSVKFPGIDLEYMTDKFDEMTADYWQLAKLQAYYLHTNETDKYHE